METGLFQSCRPWARDSEPRQSRVSGRPHDLQAFPGVADVQGSRGDLILELHRHVYRLAGVRCVYLCTLYIASGEHIAGDAAADTVALSEAQGLRDRPAPSLLMLSADRPLGAAVTGAEFLLVASKGSVRHSF